MKTEKITLAEAEKINQGKKYGIISGGCLGVWGEGDTVEDATEEAVRIIREQAGPGNLRTTDVDGTTGEETTREKTNEEILIDCVITEISA